MNKLPISVILITLNEEINIEECLLSVHSWVDEIFLIDSYSVDKTLEIARKYTDKIYQHPFENFARQRNWAQDTLPLKNEWVLHLDADERISAELAAQLQTIFSDTITTNGFIMPRKTIFRGQWIRHGGHYPVYQLRLFRKNKGRSEERMYDQNYIVNGPVQEVKGDIINVIVDDLALWKRNHKKWAKLEAMEVLFNKKRIMNINFKGNPIEQRNWFRYSIYYKMPLFIRVVIYFFYRFVIKLGFMDGTQGIIFHFWQGLWYKFLVDTMICKYLLQNQQHGSAK